MLKEFLKGKSLEINKTTIEKLGYTTSEFFYLLSVVLGNTDKHKESLLNKGDVMLLSGEEGPYLEVTPLGLDRVESILTHIDSSSNQSSESTTDYFEIAEAMQNEYPKGRKDGTNYNWRGATAVNAARLKTLVQRYGVSLNKEDIVQATRNYVQSFNGDYRYMQILKYFIFKNETRNGSVEFESQLMSYIENLGQEDTMKNDWTNNLV
jgi:hypothetical protein